MKNVHLHAREHCESVIFVLSDGHLSFMYNILRRTASTFHDKQYFVLVRDYLNKSMLT